MKNFSLLVALLFLSFTFTTCEHEEKVTRCEVLILGEGTGATSAAIQSARSGASTILVNPQLWLGGMLTAAGVSATDGNHRLPAGLWGEFRQHLRDHYGGADSIFTGWVSNTMFEPHVGAMYWKQMAEAESKLSVWENTTWTKIEKEENWLVTVKLADGSLKKIEAKQLVDGTDLGDVAAATGASYSLGMDARSTTGEAMAPERANDIVQDLTWAVILTDYGATADKTIVEPKDYDPTKFYCSCKANCDDEKAHDCDKMLSYGRLPNDKYMINWPIEGNDFYANVSEMNAEERAAVYEEAKLHTLRFVYYIQKELGYKNLGLAEDEFPTEDKLAMMPYHREGRRIDGLVQLNVNHILAPYDSELYRTGIAVGDYPIDHHHFENEDAPEIDFPSVPSFSIPMGALIPKDVDNLVIADKAISVTNIVNGSSRLQPVIIQIGQVAGLMAAMAAQQDVSPKALDIRAVQETLVQADGYLLPFIDVTPEHPQFEAIQRVGATGILRGRGVPYQWANQTWFDVDSTITEIEFCQELASFYGNESFCGQATEAVLSFDKMVELTKQFSTKPEGAFQKIEGELTKGKIAVFIDQYLDPFHAKGIDFAGKWVDQN